MKRAPSCRHLPRAVPCMGGHRVGSRRHPCADSEEEERRGYQQRIGALMEEMAAAKEDYLPSLMIALPRGEVPPMR